MNVSAKLIFHECHLFADKENLFGKTTVTTMFFKTEMMQFLRVAVSEFWWFEMNILWFYFIIFYILVIIQSLFQDENGKAVLLKISSVNYVITVSLKVAQIFL